MRAKRGSRRAHYEALLIKMMKKDVFPRKRLKSHNEILKDIKSFNEELIDYLFILRPSGKKSFVDAVNVWLDLECRIIEAKPELYIIGRGEELMKKINSLRIEYDKKNIQEIK